MDTSRTFARRLYLLERQLFSVSTQMRLGFSSIEGGYIDGYDPEGNPTVIVGELPDGTTGSIDVGGPNPPRPTGFTFEGGIRGFVSNWAGTFEGDVSAPLNLARLEIHIGTSPTFIPDLVGPTGGASSTMKGTIETPRGGGLVIGGYDPPGGDPDAYPDYFAVLVARSTSGKYSAPSAVVGPVKPVFITKIELEDFTVTAEDIAAEAVTAEAIFPGAIVAGKIAANAILAVNIQASAINTAHLQANAITAEKVAANSVTADKIFANSAFADKLAATMATFESVFADIITANMISVGALDGKTITGGLLQTDLTTVGLKFSNDGILAYSSGGSLVFYLTKFGVMTTYARINAMAGIQAFDTSFFEDASFSDTVTITNGGLAVTGNSVIDGLLDMNGHSIQDVLNLTTTGVNTLTNLSGTGGSSFVMVGNGGVLVRGQVYSQGAADSGGPGFRMLRVAN